MSRVVYFDDDLGKGEIQEEGGHAFLHLTLRQWNKGAVVRIRQVLEEVLGHLGREGHDVVFMTTHSKKTVKFWETIKPCFVIQQPEEGVWVGSWLTFEDD